MDLTNKSDLLNYLKLHDLWAKKGLSQNFLVDNIALEKIVSSAELKTDDFVIEIGPGLGTLTEQLIERAGEVVAVEMDKELAELLGQMSKSKFPISNKIQNSNTVILPFGSEAKTAASSLRLEESEVKNLSKNNAGSAIDPSSLAQDDNMGKLRIINSDILKVNLDEIIGDRKYKIVANIPYHITSKILELFLSRKNKPETIVLLVQKEVAERICAKPGQMSTLAISIQLYGQPEIVGIVSKESFFPSPKVDSAILKIKIQNTEYRIQQDKAFFRLIHIGFAAKRKTLVNNLMVGYKLERDKVIAILKSLDLKETSRAQELSVNQWKKLAGLIEG